MLLTPLEVLLNRNIVASAAARYICRRLEGKVLALEVSGLPLKFYLQSGGDTMALRSTYDGTADATLSGSPLAFLRLAGPAPEAALRAGAVQIRGDAEIAQAFSELFKQASPDLEEELSRLIGDFAAHQVGNLARSAVAFGRHAADTFAQNVAEYLQEEGRDVPTRTEAEEFIVAVDKLREDVDRLEARIALLQSRER